MQDIILDLTIHPKLCAVSVGRQHMRGFSWNGLRDALDPKLKR